MTAAARVVLSRLSAADDAQFMIDLLNDVSFVRFVRDAGVRTIDDAQQYIRATETSHTEHGYGVHRVALADDEGTPIGIAGLFKRDWLDAPDVGFAFLASFRGLGFAREAASLVLKDARERLGLEKVFAIASPENERSIHLLTKLEFRFVEERMQPSGPVSVFELKL
jgi:RimJ/RimL family protein N-acetyltransferase